MSEFEYPPNARWNIRHSSTTVCKDFHIEQLESQLKSEREIVIAHANTISRIEAANVALQQENARLKEELEQTRVQLAGCGVAAMCNTRESMEKQRCKQGDYGYSASYQDVLNAVEREITLREENARLKEQFNQAIEVIHDSTIKIQRDTARECYVISQNILVQAMKRDTFIGYAMDDLLAEIKSRYGLKVEVEDE